MLRRIATINMLGVLQQWYSLYNLYYKTPYAGRRNPARHGPAAMQPNSTTSMN